MLSILAVRHFQEQINRRQGTQRDAALGSGHFFLPLALCFLDEAQKLFFPEHLRFGFPCVLKSFVSITLLLKCATI